MSRARFVAIHGHFYQPPRESPWLERIEVQDSAAPYHDWNARVTAECYAPNTAARRVDAQNRILDVVDNFAALAFDVGPTLMAWLEHGASRRLRARSCGPIGRAGQLADTGTRSRRPMATRSCRSAAGATR